MFNSVGFLGFTVRHYDEEIDNITPHQIREAIIMKLASLDDEQLKHSVELDDTYNEED